MICILSQGPRLNLNSQIPRRFQVERVGWKFGQRRRITSVGLQIFSMHRGRKFEGEDENTAAFKSNRLNQNVC